METLIQFFLIFVFLEKNLQVVVRLNLKQVINFDLNKYDIVLLHGIFSLMLFRYDEYIDIYINRVLW